ncbi:unnamed protein product, partial [Symbiodinium microadriaticum]
MPSHQALSSLNCDEELISRTLGGVSKREAMAIDQRYREKYDVDLTTRIRDRTGGNYCKALVTWITVPDPTMGLEEAGHVTAQCITNVKEHMAALDADLLNEAKGVVTT